MLKNLAALMGLCFVLSCGTKQPQVLDESQKNPKNTVAHLNLKTGCAECHEAERLPPAEDLVVVPHGEGADCSSCHTWPAYKTINASVKAHNPYPSKCLGCHSRATENTQHAARGDCSSCHAWPAWLPPVPGGKK